MVTGEIGFQWFHQMTGNPLIDQLMLFLAEWLVLLVPLSLMIIWIRGGKEAKTDALYVFIVAIGGILLSYVAGLFYAHENPSAVYDTIVAYEPENAFPSQHTVAMLAASVGFFWRERKGYGGVVGLSALLTGFARIYVGEHWPIDILGSFLVALVALGGIMLIADALRGIVEPVAVFGHDVEQRLREKVNEYR